jgi:site-specific DNA-methyltransferase (adenine-specific)
MGARRTNSTSTSTFGVGRRESHDASEFYRRFDAPETSDDDHVEPPYELEPLHVGDARCMAAVRDCSVALVVTSPPYFAGKQYEEELERDGVPGSYAEYLTLLEEVFTECKRTLEPGGRIAVNVANLGRKPYRSLAADVIDIFQRLGLLLRGEVIWQKGEGAAGNCAWGSFRSPANPVLRDITERVIIASKGRVYRARSVRQREREGLPHETRVDADEFMAATLDLWEIPPESARRVRHPAPFPVELPERLIHLYTFRDDLVLDPFVGSGSTLIAAAKTGRRYVGYDLDPDYIDVARRRIEETLRHAPAQTASLSASKARRTRSTAAPSVDQGDFQARATREGKAAQALAEQILNDAGFNVVSRNRKVRGTGVIVNFQAVDAEGSPWFFDVSGAFTTTRSGLLRTDTMWKALGRAHVLANAPEHVRLVFLTSDLPRKGSDGHLALHAVGPSAVFDAIEMRSNEGFERLRQYAAGGRLRPLPGFWSTEEIERLS